MTCQAILDQAISNKLPMPPLKAFQVIDNEELKSIYKKIEIQEDDEDDSNSGSAILCRQCKNKITSSSNRIEKNGSHKHIFNNPGGYIFEIGCFGAANGCVNQGTPNLEFSWFAGFSWRFSLCSACHTHLGWIYQSIGRQSTDRSSGFFGLILDKLIEDETKKD